MTDSKSMEEMAFKYAVKNASLHNSKADVGAVIGKLKALFPEHEIKELAGFAKQAVQKTNAMSKQEIDAQFRAFEQEGYELKQRQKEAGLPRLEWAQSGSEKVVTRFAPNPSGYMHFGHARPAVTSGEYAKMYNGKFMLRFDDTDPKIKKPLKDADKAFVEDLKWLGYPPDQIDFASSRYDIYYGFMKKAIEIGKAYVCTCDNEEFKKLKKQKKACPHRELNPTIQLIEFEKMLSHQYQEGQAALRIKTDLNHSDPSVRDWWAAKIVDRPTYARVKKRVVFPSYNFASAIDDHELGVTLILRGQEHAQNATKQKFLYDYFGWTYPHLVHFGRLLVKDESMKLSKSAINKMQEEAGFLGFDDPRLGTIRAFRRKGFEPKAIVDFILEMGTNPQDAVVSMSKLEDLNRQLIDPQSERIVFLQKPIELTVKNGIQMTAQLPKHPDFAERASKKYELKKGKLTLWIDFDQAKELKVDDLVQLKQAYQIKITKKTAKKIHAEFAGTEFKKGTPVVHWLLPKQSIAVQVVMPDAKTKKGMAEKTVLEYKPKRHLQFERFGYVVVDESRKNLVKTYYTHA